MTQDAVVRAKKVIEKKKKIAETLKKQCPGPASMT